ncbi:MAG: hypothetical protein AAF846_08640 [Chloroflexota bacterium]
MPNIAYYVSSHGFGHAARQQAVIDLLSQQPDMKIYARTGAPAKFFASATDYHQQRYDIGMIQQDALTMDIHASLQWMDDFLKYEEEPLIEAEVTFCKSHQIDLIVSDMPSLACEVASCLGIPSVVMTHFTWDWVYAHYMNDFPQYQHIVAHLSEQYHKATLALQMQVPYPHAFDMFPNVHPIGLVYNPAKRTRDEIRQLFDVPDEMPMVLLSMGGHHWEVDNIDALLQMDKVIFLVMPDVWQQVKHRGAHFREVPMTFDGYHDVIAHADVLVGKAGGSTVAEIIGHQTLMIYTTQDESDWREIGLLRRTLDDHASSLFVPLEAFLAGDWVTELPTFIAQNHHWTDINRNGAHEAVQHLLSPVEH